MLGLNVRSAAGIMPPLRCLKESINERLAAAAEEIFRLCEGTIVQYEQELSRQRRLLEHTRKAQSLPHHNVLPQQSKNEKEDLCHQQRSFRGDENDPEPPQTKEESELLQIKKEQEEQEPPQTEVELQEPELLQIKDEPEELCIKQDAYQLELKQETETSMEIPTNEKREADRNSQQIFNGTDCQREDGNKYEESTTDVETDVDISHMSESECDSNGGKNSKKTSLVKKCKQSPNEKQLSGDSSVIKSSHVDKEIIQCDKKYNFFKESRKHFFNVPTKLHTVEKRFSCKECDKRFRNNSQLEAHIRTHTGEKPFSCTECERSFCQKSDVKTHMRVHTGEKPFSCRICQKSFSWISNLKRHMRIHTEETPLSFEKFNESFCRNSPVTSHIRTHTKEKPFSCKECEKSFSRKCDLNTHMRTHTGEKPFSCKYCEKSFSCISNLNRHARIHTGEKPFSCKECTSNFRSISNLKSHMSTHRKGSIFLISLVKDSA